MEENLVKLISYSRGEDGKNLLEQIAFVARVSNPSNQNNDATAEKLVRYLIKNNHTRNNKKKLLVIT